MNAFEQLKKEAQSSVSSQIAKQESWIKSNRKPLIIGALAVIAILAIWHFA